DRHGRRTGSECQDCEQPQQRTPQCRRLPELLRARFLRPALVEAGGAPAAASLQFRPGPGCRLLGSGPAPGLAGSVARHAGFDEHCCHRSVGQSLGTTAAGRGSTGALALCLTLWGQSFQLALLTGKLKTCRHRPLEEAVMRPTQLTSLVLLGLLLSATS